MTKDVYNIYETVIKKMCSRCSVEVRLACLQTNYTARYNQMCICIDKILKPDDGEYPTRVGEHNHECSNCSGKGKVTTYQDSPFFQSGLTVSVECPRCKGTGRG